LDRYEILFRVKIVLTGFIDHPNLVEFSCHLIRDSGIELQQLEGRGIAFVLDTYHKLGHGSLH
jgi:hypothetical protein